MDVRKRLRGKADVFRIPGNGKNSAYGLKNLDKWIGKRKWDVIHFNWGLWDLCYRHPKSKVQGRRDKVNGTITATPEHPIMKGLPEKWMHTNDELYSKMRGPGKNMHVLATGWQTPDQRGTGKDEICLFTVTYGKGRVFHTTLGHDTKSIALQPSVP